MISIPLEANLDPDETFIWNPDFPDLLNSTCRHKVNGNIDLESLDPKFNANLGPDQNLIWTEKLRCSHPITVSKVARNC